MAGSVSDLSRIPIRQRTQLVWGLLPTGLVLLLGGVLILATGGSLGFVIVGGSVAFIGAAVLTMGLGVRRTIAADRHEAAIDAAIRETVGACGSETAGPCGNECSDACSTDCAVKSLPRL